ncbi:condensation domain-containing protein [Nocardia sp. NPDC047038]|uniref:condensation domain-containing protein n=1 Tax=Nocardia sp. NPDC047038 TaxID=3154338 RepID=UPI0033D15BF5
MTAGIDRAPLTFEQHDVYLRAGQTGGYDNVGISYEISGRLEVARLVSALREVVERHDALAVRVVSEGGSAHQEWEPPTADARIVELREVRADDREQFARYVGLTYAADLNDRLGTGAAGNFRFRLLRLREDHHALLLTFGHLVVDGTGLFLIERELARILAHRAPASESVSFLAAARRQRARVTPGMLDENSSWWRSVLRRYPSSRCFPESGSSMPVLGDSATLSEALRDDPLRRLRAAAASRRMSMAQLVIATFAESLLAVSGSERICLWTFADSRRKADRGTVGMFAGLVPLMLDRAAGHSIADQVRRETLAASAHAHMEPRRKFDVFETLFDSARADGGRVFDILVNYIPARAVSSAPGVGGDLRVRSGHFHPPHDGAGWLPAALSLEIVESAPRLDIRLSYRPSSIAESHARDILAGAIRRLCPSGTAVGRG